MGVITVKPPEVGSVSKFVFAVLKPEVDRLLGFTLDDNDVKSGILHFVSHVSTAAGLEVSAGQR